MPLRTDNALIAAAEAVRRLAEYRPPPTVTDVWRRFVEGIGAPGEVGALLLDPAQIGTALDSIADDMVARFVHAGTHTTVTPTMMTAGVKQNVVPDTAVIDFDIRSLPGQSRSDIEEMIREALGDLAERAEIAFERGDVATESPAEGPLWDVLQRQAERLVPGARNVPSLLFGATDSRHLRCLGATCYGYGAYSGTLTFSDFAAMFHGDDERIDQESLRLSCELWLAVARDLLV
jgi:acetylornithine deacetylase/succinyl-diaminopimelate desuccinylase-like protein